MSDWAPIIAAIILVTGGAGAYGWQKWVDRKNALIEIRRSIYQEVLAAFSTQLLSPSSENLVALGIYRSKLFLVASDEVVKTLGNFFELAIQNNNVSDPDVKIVMSAFAKMIIAMRKDCFEKTNLSEKEIILSSPMSWDNGGKR